MEQENKQKIRNLTFASNKLMLLSTKKNHTQIKYVFVT